MIKLSREIAGAVRRGESDSPNDLTQLLDAYGAKLGTPTGDSGEAAQYFRVEGVQSESGESLRSALEQLSCVEAAYIKPTDALP